MKKSLLFIGILALLLPSCIISLHPLYTDDVIVYEDALEGQWIQGDVEDDKGEFLYWEFSKAKKGYQLLRHNKVDSFVYHAVLVKLGDHHFMDFYREVPDDCQDDIANFLPTHNFLKVQLDDDTFKLEYFDNDYLKRLFRERKIRIKHEKVNGDIVLTAESKELQQFMIKYAEDKRAFSGSYEVLEKITR
jgi:hypothetical protein